MPGSAGLDLFGVRFNNLGQAAGVLNGHLLFYDGANWGERDVLGLGRYTLRSVSDLNDRGEIVGLARNPQGTFSWGFVARSVPEPASLTMLGVGAAALLGYARRRGTRPV